MPELVIDDSTSNDVLFPADKGRGHDPAQVVRGMFAPPSEMKLIPRSEWSARIKEQERLKSRISDILLAAGVPSLDQSQSNYCWGHSVVGAVQAQRALANQPYVPLSAYAVCSTIMNGANRGGWCGLSAQFARERGIPSQASWPQGSFRGTFDAANAALHKVTEDWTDLAAGHVAEQNLTFDQLATCLLTNTPCATDWNWWSHSVLACDLVEVEPGSFGVRIRNSWGDSWEQKGFAVLRGQKAIPDGALAIRVTPATVV